MRILREDTVAVFIDVQDKLIPAMYNKEAAVAAIEKLMKGLNILDVPMIPVRQYPKGLGDYPDALKAQLGETPFSDKATFSALDTPEIAQRIRAHGKKTVLVCGLETHVCVLQTLIDLAAAGYQTALVTDCTGSRTADDRKIGIKRAAQEGALLTTSESVLFELTRASGSDEFRQISVLVK